VNHLVYSNLKSRKERNKWKLDRLVSLGAEKPKQKIPYKELKERTKIKKRKNKERKEKEREQLGIIGSKIMQSASHKLQSQDEIKEHVNQLRGNRTGLSNTVGDGSRSLTLSLGKMKDATLVVTKKHIERFEEATYDKPRKSTQNTNPEKSTKKGHWKQKSSKGKKGKKGKKRK